MEPIYWLLTSHHWRLSRERANDQEVPGAGAGAGDCTKYRAVLTPSSAVPRRYVELTKDSNELWCLTVSVYRTSNTAILPDELSVARCR
jgi:hypothetical protein